MTVLTIGMRSGPSVALLTSSRKASTSGSITGECAASEIGSRCTGTSLASRRDSSLAIEASGPDATHCSGALIAASDVCSSRSDRTASGSPMIAIIAPEPCSCIRRPRSETSRRASASEKTPPMHAATNSPRLWPTITDGCTPQLIHRRASAYWIANVAGCASVA